MIGLIIIVTILWLLVNHIRDKRAPTYEHYVIYSLMMLMMLIMLWASEYPKFKIQRLDNGVIMIHEKGYWFWNNKYHWIANFHNEWYEYADIDGEIDTDTDFSTVLHGDFGLIQDSISLEFYPDTTKDINKFYWKKTEPPIFDYY